MPASLITLPLEIQLHILWQLDRQRDRSAVARCSQDLYRLLNPVLYKEDAQCLDRWALPWACVNGVTATAIKAIEAGSPIDALYQYPVLPSLSRWQLVGMLDIAFLGKHKEVVDLLLSKGARLICFNNEVFMRNASEDVLRSVLPVLGEGRWSRRHKLAGIALREGYEKLFEVLLSSITDLQDEDFRQWPKLALQSGSLALFQRVTELGLDSSLSDREKAEAWSSVNLAKATRGLELAKFVRSHWPSLANSEEFYSHEFSACATGNVELLKWLCEEGAQFAGRAQVTSSYSYMEIAIISKSLETVKFCLTPSHAKDNSLFLRACARGTPEIVRALIQAGADPHVVEEHTGVTALQAAISRGRNDIIQCLLEYDVHVPENIFYVTQMHGQQPLFPFSLEVAHQLLARGASLMSKYPVPYERPLIIAVCERAVRCAHNDEETIGFIRLLLDHGADVNDRVANVFIWGVDLRFHTARANTGHTSPLREASRGSPKVVQFLIDNGADALAANAKGYTALHDACHARNLEVAKLLLDMGADANARTNPEFTTPLIAACTEYEPPKTLHRKRQLYNVIKLLLERGADVHAATNEGLTPLHLLASGYCWDLSCCYLLLEYGADPNARDKAGATPLHAACRSQDAALVRALLTAGADVHAKDGESRTALQYSSTNLDSERHTAAVVDVLLSFGAKLSEDVAASLWLGKNRSVPGIRDVLRKHGIPETALPRPSFRSWGCSRENFKNEDVV